MVDEGLESLLLAHDYVCREIAMAEVNETDEWSEAHTNGVKEARNRVEQAILEYADD